MHRSLGVAALAFIALSVSSHAAERDAGVRVDASGLFADFYPAAGSGRQPAVLLLGGSAGGLSPNAQGMIKALHGARFNVLHLCYFGCRGTPKPLVSVPLETFDRGLAFLRAQPSVDPDRIAVVGSSK